MPFQQDAKQSASIQDNLHDTNMIQDGEEGPMLALILILTWSLRASHLIKLVNFTLHNSLL